MADINPISPTNTVFNLPPDIQQELDLLQRRQRLAQALGEQAQAPIPVSTYNGIQAPISPLSGLAKVLSGFGSAWAQNRNAKDMADLAGKYQSQHAKALADILNPDVGNSAVPDMAQTQQGSPQPTQQLPDQTPMSPAAGAPGGASAPYAAAVPAAVPPAATAPGAPAVPQGMARPLTQRDMYKMYSSMAISPYPDIREAGLKGLSGLKGQEYNAQDYTPESWVEFRRTGDPAVLRGGSYASSMASTGANMRGQNIQAANDAANIANQGVNTQFQTGMRPPIGPEAVLGAAGMNMPRTGGIGGGARQGVAVAPGVANTSGSSVVPPGYAGNTAQLAPGATPAAQNEIAKANAEKLAEMARNKPSVRAASMGAIQSLDSLKNSIEELKGMKGLGSITGNLVGQLPGTVAMFSQSASNAQSAVDRIKSGAFVNAVNAMKAVSGSAGGTGLGALSEQEGAKLQSALVSLSQTQSTKEFINRLNQFSDLLSQSKQHMIEQYRGIYGEDLIGGAPAGQSPAGSSGRFRIEVAQ